MANPKKYIAANYPDLKKCQGRKIVENTAREEKRNILFGMSKGTGRGVKILKGLRKAVNR